jgi:hypothetical protein
MPTQENRDRSTAFHSKNPLHTTQEIKFASFNVFQISRYNFVFFFNVTSKKIKNNTKLGKVMELSVTIISSTAGYVLMAQTLQLQCGLVCGLFSF